MSDAGPTRVVDMGARWENHTRCTHDVTENVAIHGRHPPCCGMRQTKGSDETVSHRVYVSSFLTCCRSDSRPETLTTWRVIYLVSRLCCTNRCNQPPLVQGTEPCGAALAETSFLTSYPRGSDNHLHQRSRSLPRGRHGSPSLRESALPARALPA